jgi:hypothetical protein
MSAQRYFRAFASLRQPDFKRRAIMEEGLRCVRSYRFPSEPGCAAQPIVKSLTAGTIRAARMGVELISQTMDGIE